MLQFPVDKSYYYRFSTINFTKPSWRTLQTMIFSVTNPTDFVDCFETIHKMWSCSFWTQPQKVVGYHRETHHFREEKSTKEFTAPQHTRFILPPIHPTKSIAMLRGRYFSFRELHLENFMSRPNVIPTFRQRRCANRGRNFVRSKRRSTYTSSGTLYLFLRLNNSETFAESWFWAQR